MLTEKEVLNRALRALDGLGGKSITAPVVANAPLASDPKAGAFTLKGQAAELWRAGERFFVVADEEDAMLATDRLKAKRGEEWTGAELEQVARLEDQAARDLVERFKREFNGRVTQIRLEPRAKGQK